MSEPARGPTTEEPRASYVWCCSACGDPHFTREGPTRYLDLRYCPTCETRTAIIVCTVGDPFVLTDAHG